ncbi:MAG: energy transducer TonB [Elusimicrobia bacterium]|nr:energy transducer TonB [Elusimicrobiota bacterium]
MRKALEWARQNLFEACIAASLILHGAAWGVAWALTLPGKLAPIQVMEVDLNTPFRPRRPDDTRAPGAAKGAPAKALKPTPGVSGPVPETTTKPAAPVIAPPVTPQPVEKPWVLPTPETKQIEKPTLGAPETPPPQVGAAPGGTGPGGEGGRGGSGGGTGTGEAIVNRPPRLINRDEVRTLLRRNYPDSERRLGREGTTSVAIEIGTDGTVRAVELLQSSGSSDFDDAALKVARRMLFEPALVSSVPTQVKVRQSVVFRIGD